MLSQRESVLRVRDLMTKELISVDVGDYVIEAARLMAENDISSVLVKRRGEFSGMVTDRDIIKKVVSKGLDPKEVKVGEVMSAPLITISADASVEETANKMRDNKVRRLVVEDNGRKVGIISESDIVRVDSELYLLIREHSRLEAQLTPSEPHGAVVSGVCEDCGNYSTNLLKVRGRWLCEECREE